MSDDKEKKLSVPNDLSSFPTGMLIEELTKRCTPAVFIGTKYEADDKGWESFTKHVGRIETCQGLCREMDAELERLKIRQEIQGVLRDE